MNKHYLLSVLLPAALLLTPAADCKPTKSKSSISDHSVKTKANTFPHIAGEWDGKVETDGIELVATLHLFPFGDNYEGSLTAQGKGGTSKHVLSGTYDKTKKQFVFHDERVELVFGQSDWKPATMTEYILELSDDGKTLTGTCHQFAKDEKINLTFQKICDISPDQILEKASLPKQDPPESDTPQIPSDPNSLDNLALEASRASATYVGGTDYFEHITKDGVARWPKKALPIKVYITPGDDTHNYRDTYRQAIVTSFNDWTKASNYRLSWRLVAKKDDANIICKWVSKKEDLPVHKHKEQGVTHFASILKTKTDEHWLEKVEITICTSNIYTRRALKTEDVFNIARHEVGHALGITGHSNSKTDVMFPTMSRKLMPVSMRDTGTINHLYACYTMKPWD
jgi:predicted Zn-dependent protease